jgi:hypothetical protein
VSLNNCKRDESLQLELFLRKMKTTLEIILVLLLITFWIVRASEDANNTLNYFKNVTIEMARLLCSNLDLILDAFSANEEEPN